MLFDIMSACLKTLVKRGIIKLDKLAIPLRVGLVVSSAPRMVCAILIVLNSSRNWGRKRKPKPTTKANSEMGTCIFFRGESSISIASVKSKVVVVIVNKLPVKSNIVSRNETKSA